VNLGTAIVLLLSYGLYLVFLLKTHPDYFQSVTTTEAEHGQHGPQWSLGRAVGSLIGASALAAWMSELLVGAAEGTGKSLGMSEAFIGIVFLALIGGAAESGSAIAMARKNKLDLTVGIAMGSSIQIALFVAPVLVIAGHAMGRPLGLEFTLLEVAGVMLSVMAVAHLASDGRTNWFEGVQLLAIYAILAVAFFYI